MSHFISWRTTVEPLVVALDEFGIILSRASRIPRVLHILMAYERISRCALALEVNCSWAQELTADVLVVLAGSSSWSAEVPRLTVFSIKVDPEPVAQYFYVLVLHFDQRCASALRQRAHTPRRSRVGIAAARSTESLH